MGSNFVTGHPHGADHFYPVRISPPEPDPLSPPCARPKWTTGPTGAVHKVRHARGGEGVQEGVTVCERGEGGQEHVTSCLYEFLS